MKIEPTKNIWTEMERKKRNEHSNIENEIKLCMNIQSA